MHIYIQPHTEAAREAYTDHGHYHEGDAGLDLFIMDTLTIPAGETVPLKLKPHLAVVPLFKVVISTQNSCSLRL